MIPLGRYHRSEIDDLQEWARTRQVPLVLVPVDLPRYGNDFIEIRLDPSSYLRFRDDIFDQLSDYGIIELPIELVERMYTDGLESSHAPVECPFDGYPEFWQHNWINRATMRAWLKAYKGVDSPYTD